MSNYSYLPLALILTWAHPAAWAGSTPNTPPTVSLTAPLNGATYTAPATITLSATASDSNGSITKVEFYQGTTLIGTRTAAPYSVTWSNVAGGTYTLTAKATDNGRATTTSATVTITVFKVVLTTPLEGATVFGSAYVSGTYTGDTNTRVWVDSGLSTILATLSGNTFSGTVPIAPGPNTINISVVRTDKTYDSGRVTVTGGNYPVLAWTSPATASFDAPASIILAVDAISPSGTISKVDFLKDSTLIASLTAPPYQYGWNNVAKGVYTLTARATDNLGYTASIYTALSVLGPNTPPVISLTSPASGATFTTPANITLTANATDSDGSITLVEFLQNNILLSSTNVSPYSFNWTNVPLGSYALTARATDNRNSTVTSSAVNITVTLPNTPPTVSLTSPAANTPYLAPATITLSADAADSDGTIAKVEFFQGTTLIATATTAPYTYNWINVTAGTYSLTAKATDNLGGTTTTSPLMITVNPFSVAIISPASGVSISGDSVLVKGTFQAPAYSGLTINGVIAIVDSSGNFYANNVPLTPGANTLTATVTTLDENVLSNSINLTATAAGPNRTTVTPIEAISSLPATFKVSNPNLIQRVDIDTNGDGIIDFTTTGWAGFTPGQSEFTATVTYSTAGIYKPIITVTDNLNNVTNDQFVLQVHDPVVMNQMFGDLWARMLGKLRANDVPAALTSISGGVRSKYQTVFTALQPNLASTVDQLGTLSGANLGLDMSEYLIVRTSGSNTKAYPMYFIRSEDGVWRVAGM